MKTAGKMILVQGLLACTCAVHANEVQRWDMNPDTSIVWKIKDDIPHYDHIEMSGKRISVVLRYGVNQDRTFSVNKSLVWPMLRTIPNDTHASLMRRYDWDALDCVTVDGKSLLSGEQVKEISIKGRLTAKSIVAHQGHKVEVIRSYMPSISQPAMIEIYKIVNHSSNQLSVEIPKEKFSSSTDPAKGVYGSYIIEGYVYGYGHYHLQSGDTLCFSSVISARTSNEKALIVDAFKENVSRDSLVRMWTSDLLVLDTPDSVINRMFALSKIRASESIYQTKGGPMHGPGGESFYAAIWANDQAEYINPYFPFIGYDYGNESAMNSYMHFARFMNPSWKPIPSSIIAEGIDIWNGAGDRGDAAMIAYGASRYALASGDLQVARRLWPLIEWCLEYCHRKLNSGGVVASDSDELEGRFPSGDANLCTSSLYYDALISASYLAEDLHKGKHVASEYVKRAKVLRKNINDYFAATVEGYNTYAYYKGNDVLRSWICIPLTVGIDERKDGTIQALFSPRLWTENGLLTQAGDKTFWDRSTLYALRGVYAVGETEKATAYLHNYSSTRLLGDHVPYAIEAWPEGEQRHLSAESGLYGRIITEGLFGIRPLGLHKFRISPRLPQGWDYMSLRNIKAFGTSFDIRVERSSSKKSINVEVFNGGKTRVYRLGKSGSAVVDLG